MAREGKGRSLLIFSDPPELAKFYLPRMVTISNLQCFL